MPLSDADRAAWAAALARRRAAIRRDAERKRGTAEVGGRYGGDLSAQMRRPEGPPAGTNRRARRYAARWAPDDDERTADDGE